MYDSPDDVDVGICPACCMDTGHQPDCPHYVGCFDCGCDENTEDHRPGCQWWDPPPILSEEDERYERAKARAIANDFAETGGKDWT